MAPRAPITTRSLPTAASTRSSLAMRQVAFDHMVWGCTQRAADIPYMQKTIEYKLKLISGEIDTGSRMSIHTPARAVKMCLKGELGFVGSRNQTRESRRVVESSTGVTKIKHYERQKAEAEKRNAAGECAR